MIITIIITTIQHKLVLMFPFRGQLQRPWQGVQWKLDLLRSSEARGKLPAQVSARYSSLTH